MNNKLIFIATMAFVLAGCGDNDVATTGEPSMVDKAMDSAGDAANAVKDTTSDVVEDAGEMASEAMDTTREVVHDTAQDIADATRPEDMTTEEALEYMDKEMEKLAGE